MLIYLQMLETPEEKSKFEQIYLEYRNLMFYVSKGILHNQQDAEDAVQEAFLKIIKIIDQIEDPKCPKTKNLIVMIVERTAIDLWRRQKKLQRVSMEEDDLELGSCFDMTMGFLRPKSPTFCPCHWPMSIRPSSGPRKSWNRLWRNRRDEGMKLTDDLLFQHAAEARNIYLSTLPAPEELPRVSYSKAFERNMQKLIREQRRSPKINKMLRVMKRTAAAVLVIATVSFCGLMTVEAYRAKVIEFVVHVFNEFTQYRFSPASSQSNADVVELPELFFGYVPERMQEVENMATPTGWRYILYKDDSGNFFQLTQSIVADGQYDIIIDTEDSDFKVGTIRGCEAFFNSKNGENTIMWVDFGIVYKLYGNLTLDELTSLAENIKIFPE